MRQGQQGDGGRVFSREYKAAPESVGEARRWLRTVLERWGAQDGYHEAALVLSELMTNALGSDGSVTVTVTEMDGGLRIEVADEAPGVPVPRASGNDDEDGRGLLLVSALATWGWRRTRTGKIVHAFLPGARP
ncbi:hypothetical protein GCM10027589_03770 [Actinocorallia lasiicapitis]